MQIAPGTGIVEFDQQSSTTNQPIGIITADCSNPKEIDDGVAVRQLDADSLTYEVSVCVADTSRLFGDRDIFEQVLTSTEAKYYPLPNGELGYEPMIDHDLIRDLEFSEGNLRSALIIRFVVGEDLPPSDVEVVFGKVQVTNNFDYRNFGAQCRPGEALQRFGMASALILSHLRYTSGGDQDSGRLDLSGDASAIHQQMVFGPKHQAWLRGSKLNEAFMVGANHLVARLMDEEGRPAIYRVHDPEDERYLEIYPPNIALYSWEPGPHAGLNIEPYGRVTSPLRRAEDYVMSGLLKKRYKGIALTIDDHRTVRRTVQQLNRRIAATVMQGPPRNADLDVFGRNSRALAREVHERAKVVPLTRVLPGAATA